MVDIWKEREKALENEYVYRKEKEIIRKMQEDSREQLIRDLSRNRCPKCGELIRAITFRGVPLDQCPGCGGVWLGPKDLQILSEKDHRTWFDKWFKEEHDNKSATA
jgi:Zn-finger nucleic acid-binding protein